MSNERRLRSEGEALSQPVLRIVKGDPSPEELAALTALVSVAGVEPEQPAPPLRGRWNDPAHSHRRPLSPGPGAWRAAAW
jgi:hypothetical protein